MYSADVSLCFLRLMFGARVTAGLVGVDGGYVGAHVCGATVADAELIIVGLLALPLAGKTSAYCSSLYHYETTALRVMSRAFLLSPLS